MTSKLSNTVSGNMKNIGQNILRGTDVFDCEQLYCLLGLLVLEGRIPDKKCGGRSPGPHAHYAFSNSTFKNHTCDFSTRCCRLAQYYRERLTDLAHRNQSLSIEVWLLPECVHYEDFIYRNDSTENNYYDSFHSDSDCPIQDSFLLIEKWILNIIPKHKFCGPVQTVTKLLQTVTSYLHSSKLSTSLVGSKGTNPKNIYYRIFNFQSSLCDNRNRNDYCELSFPSVTSGESNVLSLNLLSLNECNWPSTIACDICLSDTKNSIDKYTRMGYTAEEITFMLKENNGTFPSPPSSISATGIAATSLSSSSLSSTAAATTVSTMTVAAPSALSNNNNNNNINNNNTTTTTNNNNNSSNGKIKLPTSSSVFSVSSISRREKSLSESQDKRRGFTLPLNSTKIKQQIISPMVVCTDQSERPPMNLVTKTMLHSTRYSIKDATPYPKYQNYSDLANNFVRKQMINDKKAAEFAGRQYLSCATDSQTPVNKPRRKSENRIIFTDSSSCESIDKYPSNYVLPINTDSVDDGRNNNISNNNNNSNNNISTGDGSATSLSINTTTTSSTITSHINNDFDDDYKIGNGYDAGASRTGSEINSIKLGEDIHAVFQKEMPYTKHADVFFHKKTGLPLQSSPAPAKRYDRMNDSSNGIDIKHNKSALAMTRLAVTPGEIVPDKTSPDMSSKKNLSSSAPVVSSQKLLVNFEESMLNMRIHPMGIIDGFEVELGASGSFNPKHVRLPLTAYFFQLSEDNAPSPYLGYVDLQSLSNKRGYQIPKKGSIQLTLFNPNGAVIKMFVVMYNLSDMPPNHQTFLRQRTIYLPVHKAAAAAANTDGPLPIHNNSTSTGFVSFGNNIGRQQYQQYPQQQQQPQHQTSHQVFFGSADSAVNDNSGGGGGGSTVSGSTASSNSSSYWSNWTVGGDCSASTSSSPCYQESIDLPSYLRYLVHLKLHSSKSGKIYLHTDIRLIFSRDKFEFDPSVATYELRSFVDPPPEPRYSPKN